MQMPVHRFGGSDGWPATTFSGVGVWLYPDNWMHAIPPQSRAREPAGGFFANSRMRAACGSYTFNSRLGLVTAAGVMPPAGWNSDAASMRPVCRHASLKNSGGTGAGVANCGAGAGCCAKAATYMQAPAVRPSAIGIRTIAVHLRCGVTPMLFSARYGHPNYLPYRHGAAHCVGRARTVGPGHRPARGQRSVSHADRRH